MKLVKWGPKSSVTGPRVRGCCWQRARGGTSTEVREENGDTIGEEKEKKSAFHVRDPQKKGSLVSSGASLVCICAFGVAPLFLGLC